MQSMVFFAGVKGFHPGAGSPCLWGRHIDSCTHKQVSKLLACAWLGQQSGERRAGYLAYPTLICITGYETPELVKSVFKDSPSPGSQ